MFVFVQSMWSKSEINADSNYVVWSQFVKAASKLRPDVHWLVMFPDDKSGFKYENDGFFSLPNVTRIPQRVPIRRTANAVNFPAEWYEKLFRSYAFDAVWSHLPEVSAQIKASGRTTREDISKPTVVSQHNYVVHRSLPYEFHGHLAFMELMGAACSDANVFNTEHCKSMFDDIANEHIVPNIRKQIEAKSYLIPYGTLEPELGIDKKRKDNKVPIIAYNHRLLTHKRYGDTFKILDSLWREGVQFRLRFLNNTADKIGAVRRYPWAEVCLCKTRKEYMSKLSECDINAIHSVHETFCISAAESMAMGQPLVAPNGVTFPEITGHTSGNEYPFLFDTDAESKEMLRLLLTNKAVRLKWGEVVSEHVCQNYNTTVWVKQTMALFDRLTKYRVGLAPARLEKVKEGLLKCSGQPITKLYTWLNGKNGMVNNKQWFGTQTATLTKLLRLVRYIGGSVVIENGKQIVRKND